MAGHSKWANIKHRKDRADKKKGKIFSRVMKEIISAVKQQGPDPKSNSKLRIAIQKAKDANVPIDSVERNIRKASLSDQQDYSEMTYELYGYGGVGIIVDIMTDNRNRISADIQIAINKNGGTIATPGAVAYNFERKGFFRIPKGDIREDELFLLASDMGAEDFSTEEEDYLITTSISNFLRLKESLEKANFKPTEAELAMIPKTYIDVSEQDTNDNITLIEWLENLDDVDQVYHNMKV
jgi:YebC/PmpR family DNA-binding regulatory protein